MKAIKNRFQVFVLAVLTCVLSMQGQREAQYTQYMYNTSLINPAYAGNEDVLKISALHRSQWVGVNGAPTTQTLNIEDKIVGNLGGSLNISKDAIGPLSEVLFDVNISYAVQLNSMGKLAFGLKAGGRLLDIDLNKGNLRDYQSPATTNVKDGEFSPVLGAGLYYYTDRGYLGVSASNLLKNNYYDNDSGSNLDNSHFYLIGGYVFDLSESLKFKPAMMVKAVVGAPYSFDFSANFMYQERLVMGAAYRYNAAVSGLLGIYITKQFFVGYAYDYDLELNQNISGGSHEIFLGLRFSLDKSYVSPRFF
jgi:type IX secretion system PorP/SprF family membrane protein